MRPYLATFAVAAIAAAFSFGVHASSSPRTLIDRDLGPSASFSYKHENLGSSFTDTLAFKLDGSKNWTASGSAGGDFIGINIDPAIFNLPFSPVILGQGLKEISVSIFGRTFTDTLDPIVLGRDYVGVTIPSMIVAPDTYIVTISGKAKESPLILGKPSYTFSLVAQPVPEPQSYAMMLAGLGLIGVMVRRGNRPAV